ncbi:hypothetical protein INR49_032447, partial [Caranx melampygus]
CSINAAKRRAAAAAAVASPLVTSDLEGGDVEILPEGQPQHVQVLTAISKCTGECDEDCQERKRRDRYSGSTRITPSVKQKKMCQRSTHREFNHPHPTPIDQLTHLLDPHGPGQETQEEVVSKEGLVSMTRLLWDVTTEV